MTVCAVCGDRLISGGKRTVSRTPDSPVRAILE